MNADRNKSLTPLQRFNTTLTSVQMQDYLKMVLADNKDSFVNNITALVANNANLQDCSPMSLIYAGIRATAFGLPLDNNLGFAYVIPYNTKKKRTVNETVTDPKTGEQSVVAKVEDLFVKEAQLQLGYKAFVQLAIRSGQFSIINVTEVREGEIVGRDLLSGEMTLKMAENRNALKVVGYVAFFALVNGFRKMHYMTVEEMEAHAKRYSQSYSSRYESTRKSSLWTTDFDTMAKKTVLKLLLSKYAPLSIQMQSAIKYDQASFGDNGEVGYPDGVDEQGYVERMIDGRKQEMRDSDAQPVEMP